MSSPPFSAILATAAAPTATTTLMRVLVVRAERVTLVRKTRVRVVTRAGTKVRRAPVLAVDLALDLMFVLLQMAPSAAMLELQTMVAPQVQAKVAIAAAQTATTTLLCVLFVHVAIVPEVGMMGVMAVARAGTTAEPTPVLAVTVLLDRMLDLSELALVSTKLEMNRLAPTTANSRVATAAAHTAKTTLMRVLVVRVAVVPEVGKMGVMAVATAGTKGKCARVLVVVRVLDLMFVLLQVKSFVTLWELQTTLAPPFNAKVATTAAPTVTTAFWRVLVVRAAIVTAVCTTGVMAVVRAGPKVECAPVLAVMVLLDLMLELLELALVPTKFELRGVAPPAGIAKVATAEAPTTTTALYGVTAAHTVVVPVPVKTGVMVVLVVGAKVNSC